LCFFQESSFFRFAANKGWDKCTFSPQGRAEELVIQLHNPPSLDHPPPEPRWSGARQRSASALRSRPATSEGVVSLKDDSKKRLRGTGKLDEEMGVMASDPSEVPMRPIEYIEKSNHVGMQIIAECASAMNGSSTLTFHATKTTLELRQPLRRQPLRPTSSGTLRGWKRHAHATPKYPDTPQSSRSSTQHPFGRASPWNGGGQQPGRKERKSSLLGMPGGSKASSKASSLDLQRGALAPEDIALERVASRMSGMTTPRTMTPRRNSDNGERDRTPRMSYIPRGSIRRHSDAGESMWGPPPGLVYMVLDDSALIRLTYKRVVSVLLAGHESSQVLGGTEDEITGFVPLVLSMSPPPDIIILDQNLDSPERPSVQVAKGTDIMRELIEGGHKGPIVIRSANDSPLHEAMFIKAGAAAMISKSANQSAVFDQLGQVWRDRLMGWDSRDERQPKERLSGSGYNIPHGHHGEPDDREMARRPSIHSFQIDLLS